MISALENIWMQVQKPGRYTGGEVNSTVKDKSSVSVRFALCYPDLYEVGMSNLGIKILYELMNARPDTWCERVFAPAADMEAQLRAAGLPLYGLESKDPISQFDIVGFSLQFELNYTCILQMMELGGIPFYASERGEDDPLVIAGGPCVVNSEPVAPFFDLVLVGTARTAFPPFWTCSRRASGRACPERNSCAARPPSRARMSRRCIRWSMTAPQLRASRRRRRCAALWCWI